MNEKLIITSLETLASAIASVSRSVVAMQKGDTLAAKEQIETCVGLLADFQELRDQLAGGETKAS
ncbi:hypothetical protein [Caulobacter radicis]|uniref:Uncharacterized protein n=1 Tax=Caulobacter radicis TaxID=2172650 RepID=A0A2T9J7J7_9CAUL|nr:hypothetical protein [Caulobacter radicis]PVM77505.1 hypothetical protein DDF65_16385 [Caulobacter radicis]